MINAYQPITIKEIPENILFEGYYWYSNEHSPTIITHEIVQQSWFKELPFVIEAHFYSSAEQISMQVRNIDGVYHVAKIDLSRLIDITHDIAFYIGHDLGGRNFEMIHAWEPQVDELLAGMETLIPTWTAFAGFTTK